MLMDIRDMIQVVLDQNLMSPQVQAVMKQYNIPQQTLGNNALVNNFIRNPQSGRILPQSPYYQLTDAQAIQDPEKRQEALNNATMGMVMGMTTPVEPKPTAKSLTALVESARGVQRDSVIVSAQNALDRIHQSPTGVRDYAPVYDFLKNAEAGKDTPDQMRAVQELLALHGEANLSTKLPTQTGETLYHSGAPNIKEVNLNKSRFDKTFYMSENPEYAKSFGGPKAQLNEMVLDPKAKLADMRKPSSELVSQIEKALVGEKTGKTIKLQRPDGTFLEVPEMKGKNSNAVYSNQAIIQGIKDGKAMYAELPEVKAVLRKLGYDGQITTESKFGSNYGVWNKDIVKPKSLPTQVEGLSNTAKKDIYEMMGADKNIANVRRSSANAVIGTDTLRDGRNVMHIADIKNTTKGNGEASKLLDDLISHSKETGNPISLVPLQTEKGGLNNRQLVDWYKRKGFVEIPNNSLQAGDYGKDTLMLYDPVNQSKGVQNKGGGK